MEKYEKPPQTYKNRRPIGTSGEESVEAVDIQPLQNNTVIFRSLVYLESHILLDSN